MNSMPPIGSLVRVLKDRASNSTFAKDDIIRVTGEVDGYPGYFKADFVEGRGRGSRDRVSKGFDWYVEWKNVEPHGPSVAPVESTELDVFDLMKTLPEGGAR